MILEYIWLDGYEPQSLRSKTKIISKTLEMVHPKEWSFDGSSTKQAEGTDSDCILKPMTSYHDPFRGDINELVLCEVMDKFKNPHKTNTRSILRENMEDYTPCECWFGFEQEYVLTQFGKPLGFPSDSDPKPQGEYYCGVGHANIRGREIVEEHMNACLAAKIGITGTNAEVMIGQWEYQIFSKDPVKACDDVIMARYLLYRIAEKHGINVTFYPKPVEGDWNGSGMHVNFSTSKTRDKNGIKVIEKAVKLLEKKHKEHIDVYGIDNEKRLTGKHETCDINTFKYGVSDRSASIRIPVSTVVDNAGYLEDRRPGSNADPYLVADRVMKTICV